MKNWKIVCIQWHVFCICHNLKKNFFIIMSKTMKCLGATIAFYFLLTLLFSTLSIISSLEKKESSQIFASTQSNLLQNHANRHKLFQEKWKTFFRLLVGIHKPRISQTSLLPQTKNNILFRYAVNKFLLIIIYLFENYPISRSTLVVLPSWKFCLFLGKMHVFSTFKYLGGK